MFQTLLPFVHVVAVDLNREFCEQLDSLVGPQLTLLASDICEQYNINRRISGSVLLQSFTSTAE